ncbi:hypothetical protein [Desulfospira joergensenii]|uniref:hypothetical protein n=1 Tax=Desulfospira joergensenii TaxID=53329 RepID=UPI0003B6F363|nr:hypothetical protein [Desulfospira joergensenii]
MKTVKPIIYYASILSLLFFIGGLFNISVTKTTTSGMDFILEGPLFMLVFGAGLLGFAGLARKVWQNKAGLSEKSRLHVTDKS